MAAGSETLSITRGGWLCFPPVNEALRFDLDGNLTEDARSTYDWDGDNRLIWMEEKPIAGTGPHPPQQRLEYDYDSQSHRIAKRELQKTHEMSDWSLHQHRQFLYDGWNMIGELDVSISSGVVRLHRSYAWDADIHLTSVTTEGHREAQRIEEPGTTGAAPRGATGPVASEQASGLPHVAPQNAPSKTTTTRFLYDPLHRRIARIKDSGEVTLYTYEGWNVVAEKTTIKETATTTRYTWGEDLSGSLQGAGGIGGLLRSTIVEAKPNGTRKTEHEHTFSYDSNGNIILLTGAKAQETARYSYDAFGKTLTATGPAAQTNRYQFSTKPVEEESGLVYYGYRWYDPVTGRWPSRDPIEERGGVNLYGMVGNNSLSRSDFLGNSPTLPAVFYVMAGAVSGCACALGLNSIYDIGYALGNGLCGSMVGCSPSPGAPRDFWDIIGDNITLKNCVIGAITGAPGGPATGSLCVGLAMPVYVAGGIAGCYDAWQGNPYNG